MGQVQSQQEDEVSELTQVRALEAQRNDGLWNLFSSCLQPVVPVSASAMATRSFASTARKALPVRNPFVVKFDEVVLKTNHQDKKELYLTYTALQKCQAVLYHHISSSTVQSLSDCSTPETVPADWELKGVQEMPAGESRQARIVVGAFREEEPSEILLLNVSAMAVAADAKWTQWYYLRFEPFKSGELGTYMLTQWEEKMQIGKKVYAIMKIYSTKDEAASTSAICLICSTEAANTMVLPCRHLCLCSECAAAVRMRDQKCPICRAGISSLLQLESTTTSLGGETATLTNR